MGLILLFIAINEKPNKLATLVVWQQGIQRIVFQTNFQPGRGRRRSGWWPFRKRLQCTQNYLKLQNSVPRLNFFFFHESSTKKKTWLTTSFFSLEYKPKILKLKEGARCGNGRMVAKATN